MEVKMESLTLKLHVTKPHKTKLFSGFLKSQERHKQTSHTGQLLLHGKEVPSAVILTEKATEASLPASPQEVHFDSPFVVRLLPSPSPVYEASCHALPLEHSFTGIVKLGQSLLVILSFGVCGCTLYVLCVSQSH
jgi:hypothetical protein